MELGIDSFAAAFTEDSRAVSASDRLNDLLEQIRHADRLGLDSFGIGEHHRREFLDSAPPVILGAAAARTDRIRLSSAVTVLSAADPVRLFQEFATLDLLSRGRAEVIVGRGSSIEAQLGPDGALLIGDPEGIAEKLIRHSEALGGLSRVTFQMNAASLPHERLMRSIELIGTRVAPIVREKLGVSR